MALETPRLVLRPLTVGDVGIVHCLFIDPDVRRWAMDGRVLPEASVRTANPADELDFDTPLAGPAPTFQVPPGSFGIPCPSESTESVVLAVWFMVS